ncbi:MAG: F0F1 ATP synthase subunit gamma [Alphaproteobacteria bacterium]
MATLKELKTRISSVSSTKKITSAMKMIAAARLRQAQKAVEASRPYAKGMSSIMGQLAGSVKGMENPPAMLVGRDEVKTVLFIVVSSERGLCGGFNANVVRETRRKIALIKAAGQEPKLLCVGKKAKDALKGEFKNIMIDHQVVINGGAIEFDSVQKTMTDLTAAFEEGVFDKAYIIYNRFVNAITQEVVDEQIVPVNMPEVDPDEIPLSVEFEPSEDKFVADILPKSLVVKLYGTILESFAAEQAARMTAMDNASRNAGDMIKDLTLQANRQRQAAITTELTEIISGAEAV